MDPTQTLIDILGHLSDAEAAETDGHANVEARANAIGALRDLADWLARAGFSPAVAEAIRKHQDVTGGAQ